MSSENDSVSKFDRQSEIIVYGNVTMNVIFSPIRGLMKNKCLSFRNIFVLILRLDELKSILFLGLN